MLDDDAGGWIDASRYAGSVQLFNGELGKYAGVRFISTTQAPVLEGDGQSGNDVYQTVIAGKNSIAFGDYGTVEAPIIEKGGVSDPLHQQMTVGWKAWLAACLVGEGDNTQNMGAARYIVLHSAASIG